MTALEYTIKIYDAIKIQIKKTDDVISGVIYTTRRNEK